MNICIFSTVFFPSIGGQEIFNEIIANEFIQLGHNVEVVTDTISSDNLDKFPFKVTRTKSIIDKYKSFKRADIILLSNFTLKEVPIAVLSGKKIIINHQISYLNNSSYLSKFLQFIKRKACRFFINIPNSKFTSKHISGKSYVVKNLYNDKLFIKKKHSRTKDFVFCGRLVNDKGIIELADSFKIVLEQYPNSSLTIIGDGADKNNLQQYCKKIDINKNVNFENFLSGEKLQSKLIEHLCMVIPSIWEEPFGIVALEGIASCDVIISSNRGGLPEAVGSCGYLVEPTVNKLSKTMIFVIKNRNDESKFIGNKYFDQCVQHLDNFAPRSVAKRYLEIFKNK
jgi:glycogen synthase